MKTTREEIVVAGDFNSKSPEWGETRADKSTVCEFIARNDLVVLNRGCTPTFVRGNSSSIIDLTIGTTSFARKVVDWKVMEDETLSDHRYIVFKTSPGEIKSTDTKRQPLGWNTKKLHVDVAQRNLEEARKLDSLNCKKKEDTLEDLVKVATSAMTAACGAAMPRRRHFGGTRCA